ncbi:MAG: hypothetical protein HYU63_08455, partial [Armatimonadetes bacterium]|nr:hypothetical protein [Armatimonadota bacterium]
SSADLAEYIKVDDSSIEAGDLVSVSIKKNKTAAKSKSPYDNKMLGIISTKPAMCGGHLSRKKNMKVPDIKNNNNKKIKQTQIIDDLYTDKEMHKLGYRKLALVGQVPAKVCLEGGIIHKGDPLTSSSLAGYAMKALKSGPIVGKALEDFDGSKGKTGKILVFCNLSFNYSEEEIEKLKTENKELKNQLSDINIRLEKLEKLINK